MKKIGRIMIIISLALVIFGTTCLILSKKEDQKIYYVRNCKGDTIAVTVHMGELVDTRWGEPLEYCDRCHSIINGAGGAIWHENTICDNCWHELSAKYRGEL